MKKMEKEGVISEDEHKSFSDDVQKLTDATIAEIDAAAFDSLFASEARAMGHELEGEAVLAVLAGAVRPAMVAALAQAQVGIAVHGATDAAKNAADMILTEPGLSAIYTAIYESRKIFQRLRAYVLYRMAATDGFRVFDFGFEGEGYKKYFVNARQTVREAVVIRPGLGRSLGEAAVAALGGAGGRGQALRNSLRRRWSTIEACEASSLGQLRGAAFALGSAVSKAAAKRKGPARVAHV